MRYLLAFLFVILFTSQSHAEIKTETVEYSDGEAVLEGYLAYDGSVEGKRPGVLVVHEWWGINDYVKRRAREIASLGYVAFAPDIYGKGIRPADAKEAGKQASLYRNDRNLMRRRAEAGLKTLKAQRLVDTSKVAALGYCFGGTTVLELARGGADIRAAVSFHGGLDTPNPVEKGKLKARVLALHGGDDPYVAAEDVRAFQDEMRRAGADWQMNIYGGAVHSFTNPDAGSDTTKGLAYDKKADERSWEAMRLFLQEALR